MLFLIASFISASLHLRSSLSLSLCTFCTAAYGVQLSVEQRQHITDPISLFTALHIAYPMLSAGRLLHGTFHVQWIRMKRRRVISKYTKKKCWMQPLLRHGYSTPKCTFQYPKNTCRHTYDCSCGTNLGKTYLCLASKQNRKSSWRTVDSRLKANIVQKDIPIYAA